MSNEQILEYAMKLKPDERLLIIQALLQSLDIPDQKIDSIWIKEAENRLNAYKNGKLKGVPMEKVFPTL